MSYEVALYKGNQWGILHKPTKNWCIFGDKAKLIKIAALLNKEG